MVSKKRRALQNPTDEYAEPGPRGVSSRSLEANGLATRLNETVEHSFAEAAEGLRVCYAEMVRDVEAGLRGLYESTITEIRRASVADHVHRMSREGRPSNNVEIYLN